MKTLIRPKNPIWSVIFPLAFYVFMLATPSINITFRELEFHFYVVSSVSIIAAGISITLGISGIRIRNIQVQLVALAFISLTIFFSLHGLTTPGLLIDPNPVVGIAVQLSFLFLVLWLLASTLPGDNWFIKSLQKNHKYLTPAWTGALILISAVGFNRPDLFTIIPIHLAPLRNILSASTIILALASLFRYWQSYRYTQFQLQLNLARVAGLITAAQVIVSTAELWALSWWLYHILLLAAMILATSSLIQHQSQGESLELVIRGMFSDTLSEKLKAGVSPKVEALVQAAEARDPYTAGHSYRVALAALKLGEALDLDPEELRALVQGSILHDIGKLKTPDDILKKPGKLTEPETKIIQEHPITGYEMCKGLGFMNDVLDIIKYHHERCDGNGYPDGLTKEAIPYLARVLAIADAFDAMTTDRAYRKSLSKDQAIKTIKENPYDQDIVSIWEKHIV